MIGLREPNIYGNISFESYYESLLGKYKQIDLFQFQSNIEGELISEIQESREFDGLIINAGAYTHTSIGIRDAISAINTTTIEVHISNIFDRETFRNKSIISQVCQGHLSGLGIKCYELALLSFTI